MTLPKSSGEGRHLYIKLLVLYKAKLQLHLSLILNGNISLQIRKVTYCRHLTLYSQAHSSKHEVARDVVQKWHHWALGKATKKPGGAMTGRTGHKAVTAARDARVSLCLHECHKGYCEPTKPLMELVGALIAAHLVPWGSRPGEPPVPPSQASQAGSTSQFGLLVAFFMKTQALNNYWVFMNKYKSLLMLINQEGTPPKSQTNLSAALLAHSSA